MKVTCFGYFKFELVFLFNTFNSNKNYFQIFIGIFQALLHFQIKAGDQSLKQHLEDGKKNATYTSPHIQNDIIQLCGMVIKDYILKDAKEASAYSLMADESQDISGKEQLSIGIRFFDEIRQVIREEFLGFVELDAMDAKTIALTIDNFIIDSGLDPKKFIGQGYDGCATMSGKDNGVQSILRKKYTHALYFHCASHKLNLVINDLNLVPEIRNTIATIKDIINFFRESTLRRKYVPHIPAFCETRWSYKYKSIAIFKQNFINIVNGLEKLSKEGNYATQKTAFQLNNAVKDSTFILCLVLISKYSALLEPVANVLQAKHLDLFSCTDHMKKILNIVKKNRRNAEDEIENLLADSQSLAQIIGVTFQKPRTIERQKNRSNPPSTNETEYWKISLLIPYLDFFISSIERRFHDENLPAFSLFLLHPANMLKINFQDFKKKTTIFTDYYSLQNFDGEAELWYNHWKDKQLSNKELESLDLCEVVKETGSFFPIIKQALHITLALPCTTSTIERSFSTLRRVKMWLRSTMTENRLNGKN